MFHNLLPFVHWDVSQIPFCVIKERERENRRHDVVDTVWRQFNSYGTTVGFEVESFLFLSICFSPLFIAEERNGPSIRC